MASVRRSDRTGPVCVTGVVLVWTAAAASAWGQDARHAGPTLVELRQCAGRATFLVMDAGGRVSAATRVTGQDRVSGYVVHSHVIVRAPQEAGKLLPRIAGVGTVQKIEAAPGFWLLSCGSILEASAACLRIEASGAAHEAYLDIQPPWTTRAAVNDPGYPQQWHLTNLQTPGADSNAQAAWAAGYTGAGVTVGIVEGGFETTHADLAGNYSAAASQSGGSATFHGTSVAGVVAAVANNNQGGVGVAWGSKISKLIYGTPSMNATAIGFRNDLNWVKNNSWGPADNGNLSYITSVELTALRSAVQTGRGGKGTVFTWAAGNGGTSDRIDYDPYASNRYVLPIGGIGDLDVRSSFNESGSAMFMVAHTSGNVRGIYTTDYTGVNGFSTGDYTSTFGGTSAAAPLAAGAIACVLQANPNLSWRDVQHVLIESSRRCDPASPSWSFNAAGRAVSYDYGFGAVDVGAAVALARQWLPVKPEVQKPSSPQLVNAPIPDNNAAGISRAIAVSGNLRVETVEVTVNIQTTNIGDLEIVLTSPSGTASVLATAPRADTQDNITNYTFTSRRHWGETAGGPWALRVADRRAGEQATWINWSVAVYGSPCPADFNSSGFVDTEDYDAFTAAFGLGHASADIDQSGFVDLEDFDSFIQAFERGC